MPELRYLLAVLCKLVVLASLVLAGCAPKTNPVSTSTTTSNAVPNEPPIPASSQISVQTATIRPLPELTLTPGDFFFSLNGQPAMIFSRNITGKTREDFSTVLEYARQGGTRVIRIHLTAGWWGDAWINKDWTVNEKWAQNWEWLFNQAQADGMFILPVFGVWSDWNNGTPDFGGALWQFNPLNKANGGPVKAPGELFQPDSITQKMWMAWVKALVTRWQNRTNILAWEIFSEINIASGFPGETDTKGAAAESSAVYFTNQAASIIRTADTYHRPLTLSLAGGSGMPLTGQWPGVNQLEALDFIQIHPYTGSLDREIVSDVRSALTQYNKPVLIGESGLWGDLAIAKNAFTGVEHAIWAGMVSGAMNARALWSNDSYAFFEPDRALALQYMQLYATAELPAANFANKVDFTDFKPVTTESTGGVWGAALGNESSIIGWYRDAQSEPPDWNLQNVVTQQTITLTVPVNSSSWKVDFYDTRDGTTILSTLNVISSGNKITIPLPDFQNAIAIKMTAQAAAAPTPSPLSAFALAGKWTGIISNPAGNFSTQLLLSIQTACELGKPCGTFSTPQIPCSGNLVFLEVKGETFLFQEQNAAGPSSCPSGGYERLRLQTDGTIFYEYLTDLGAVPLSTGVLKHP